jgi:hypothetical protein
MTTETVATETVRKLPVKALPDTAFLKLSRYEAGAPGLRQAKETSASAPPLADPSKDQDAWWRSWSHENHLSTNWLG